jgi:hypothetical protein
MHPDSFLVSAGRLVLTRCRSLAIGSLRRITEEVIHSQRIAHSLTQGTMYIRCFSIIPMILCLLFHRWISSNASSLHHTDAYNYAGADLSTTAYEGVTWEKKDPSAGDGCGYSYVQEPF